jgi:hypothetical protein
VLGVFANDGKPWRPVADDDRYVRNALRKTNRYDGDVFVKTVGISDLSSYGPLVNELNVTQTPAVVVIGADLKGTVLTGYADRISLNQTIADVRRSSITPTIADSFLRQANKLCGRYETRYTRWSGPTVRGKKPERAAYLRAEAIVKQYHHAIAGLPATTQWRPLQKQWVSVMAMRQRTLHNAAQALLKRDLNGFYTAVTAFDAKSATKLDNRFNDVGLTDCAYNRRA